MTKVVPISVDDGIIERLQELLSRAKRGELVAIGWCAVTNNGITLSAWDTDTLNTRNGIMLLGAANRLVWRINREAFQYIDTD